MSEGFAPARAIQDRDQADTVVVIGLGYVGRPIALAAAEAGLAVLGFDPDDAARARAEAAWQPGPGAGPLATTGDARSLPQAGAWVIAVPTPLDADGEPDLGAVRAALASVAPRLAPGALVTLVSTCQPGATRTLCLPALERSGLRAGRDFFLAVSPERENPGHRSGLRDTPRLLGALDDASMDVALRFWRRLVPHVVPVASADIAECAKLLENTYRLVNIALMGELHAAFTALGVPTAEVVRAAATKPFGFQPFWPGLGAGGHCIPVDPAYLRMEARRVGTGSTVLDAALRSNVMRAEFVAARIVAHFDGRLRGRRILVAGVCYKPEVPDLRCSAAVRLLRLLASEGADVCWHDPVIGTETRELSDLPRSAGLLHANGARADAVVLGVPHRAFDDETLCAGAPVVFDPFGVLPRRAGTITV